MLLTILLLFPLLVGCSQKSVKQISCSELVAVYEAADYEVFHNHTQNGEREWICHVGAEDDDCEEYVHFYIFENEEAAEAYAGKRKWNVVLWLYTLAMFEPTWLITDTYGNIEFEYDSGSDLIEPFSDFINR